jgi:FMN phosphatase YigB (HAD superfamily)
VPARRAGLRTAWLQPDPGRVAPDPSLVDFRLTKLADLPACLPALASV